MFAARLDFIRIFDPLRDVLRRILPHPAATWVRLAKMRHGRSDVPLLDSPDRGDRSVPGLSAKLSRRLTPTDRSPASRPPRSCSLVPLRETSGESTNVRKAHISHAQTCRTRAHCPGYIPGIRPRRRSSSLICRTTSLLPAEWRAQKLWMTRRFEPTADRAV